MTLIKLPALDAIEIEQNTILHVADEIWDYAELSLQEFRSAKLYCEVLKQEGFRVEVDSRNEKIGKKIREATLEKIPFMLVVGDRDMENGTVSVRTRKGEDLGAMTLEDFSAKLRQIVDEKQKI